MKFAPIVFIVLLLVCTFVIGESFGKMQAIEALVPPHGVIDCFVPDPPRSLRVSLPR